LEFYAKWCPPCHALDRRFFNQAEVIKLSYQLVPIRIDATLENSEIETLINKYQIVGWPTILFVSPAGKVYKDLTVTSFTPDKLKENMEEAIKRVKG
jgi:thiol:disulfide interchange protein DsbD